MALISTIKSKFQNYNKLYNGIPNFIYTLFCIKNGISWKESISSALCCFLVFCIGIQCQRLLTLSKFFKKWKPDVL